MELIYYYLYIYSISLLRNVIPTGVCVRTYEYEPRSFSFLFKVTSFELYFTTLH